MFIGTVPSAVRGILRELAQGWGKELPVYIACSGNFTIEHSLTGVCDTIHSNDVSLYSSVVGCALLGNTVAIRVKRDDLAWMAKYLHDPRDAVATMVLCLEYLPFALKDARFFRRTWEAVEERWPQLHADTRKKTDAALASIKIASYCMSDCVEFVQRSPVDCGVMAFPPTYAGGYERIFKALGEVFEWREPSYTLFDDDRLELLVEALQTKKHWALYSDQDIPELLPNVVGLVVPSARAKPIRIYADMASAPRVSTVHQKLEPVMLARVANDPLAGEMGLHHLTQGQLNTLRSEYLGKNIAPAGATIRLAVTVNNYLAGAIAFVRPTFGEWCDAYLMTDLAVAPTRHQRLSKLVLMAALSREVQQILSEHLCQAVGYIGTTAFTDKPVSMKYRGLFDLVKRDEGRLNYSARAGQWKLSEVLERWKKRYSKSSN